MQSDLEDVKKNQSKKDEFLKLINRDEKLVNLEDLQQDFEKKNLKVNQMLGS